MDAEIGHEELRPLVDAVTDERDDAGTDGGGGDLDRDGEVRLVDVRPPGAFARAHVPGSENVPLDALVDEVERFAGADRVVTLCPHGKMSVRAARLIAAYEGFDGRVESFAPGLTEWDGPVASGDGASGEHGGESTDDASDEGPEAPF